MASIRKRGSVWKVEIFKNSIRKSASFSTKAEATAWAAQTEADIVAGKRGRIPPGKTFGDLLLRYSEEVSVTKRGERWELIRINSIVHGSIKHEPDPLCSILPEWNRLNLTAWLYRRTNTERRSTRT